MALFTHRNPAESNHITAFIAPVEEANGARPGQPDLPVHQGVPAHADRSYAAPTWTQREPGYAAQHEDGAEVYALSPSDIELSRLDSSDVRLPSGDIEETGSRPIDLNVEAAPEYRVRARFPMRVAGRIATSGVFAKTVFAMPTLQPRPQHPVRDIPDGRRSKREIAGPTTAIDSAKIARAMAHRR